MATISPHWISRYSAGPSTTKTAEVAVLQRAIRDALGDSEWDTFLQGSYRNDTGIADINDVDIVARRKGATAPLPASQWESLFRQVATRVNGPARFRGKVTIGDKCINVDNATASGLSADIVPAVAVGNLVSDPIAIYSRRLRRERPNYPRTHYQHGVNKQGRTSNAYKPTVRLFKRWVRQYANYARFAPSFYIECAVYKASDGQFSTYLPRSFYNVGRTLLSWDDYAVINSVAGDKDIRTRGEWEVEHFREFKAKLGTDVNLVGHALAASSTAEADRLWKTAFGE